MIAIEIIAHTCLVLELCPATPNRQLYLGIELVFFDVQFLLKVLFCAVMPVVECYGGKRLQSACAVFQSEVVVVVPFVVLPRLAGSHQTESVALWL